ncbi:MAG TPA: response regulator [Mycobacteriales bacterium]|jgi:twitching motility two-component system response regulator PilH|nr:response regulator [Mycobacteriales bacterium]
MPTVVIADDSPTLRRILTSVLTKEGFEVVVAEDGVSAVQQVFANMPDAVVLDVQMPRVSGYVAARLLKDDWQTADIPVILLTSLDAASDRYWGAQTGADRYFTKDFEAPQLVVAVREVIQAAKDNAAGPRGLRPDPVELGDDDVMSRVCDLLDRKLFETSVAAEVTALAATMTGFEQTVAGVLDVLRRFVDYDLASVVLLEEHTAYVAVAQETSQAQYAELLGAAVDALNAVSGAPLAVNDLELRLADPEGLLGEEDERGMATFLSMPLKGHGGHIIGLVALSSGQKNAFGETALSTLRLVDGPAAIVIDNARLAQVRAGA